jgi:GTP pyrophosphokinase
MIREDLQTDLTPWQPEPTIIPNEWRQFIQELEQQSGRRTRQYLLESVPYDAQGTADLLISWGLSVSTVMAAYLLENDHQLISASGLEKADEVVRHIQETIRYADDFDAERLPPLLTPPYRDLEALILTVAAYCQTFEWLKRQSNGLSYKGKLLIGIERAGKVLLNITKRLGMWQLKREVEDSIEQLSNLSKFEEDRREREFILGKDRFLLDEVRDLLVSTYQGVARTSINVVPHPCSVVGLKRRMQDAHTTTTSYKDKLSGFDLVTYDLIVPTVRDCYAALGILSQLGLIQDRVTDHIANPKPNGYSHIALGLILDQTLLENKQKPVCQLQIATPLMRAIGMYGCLHPKYRECLDRVKASEKIEPLSIEEHWGSDTGRMFQAMQAAAMREDAKNVQSPIIVYDKDRNPISLPINATALDFAYVLGKDTGNMAVEAIINNRKAPLSRPLEAGDIVEIRTASESQVSVTWLDEYYTITSNAREGIKSALKRLEAERKGYELLREELKRFHYLLSDKELDEEIRLLRHKYNLGPRREFLQRLSGVEQHASGGNDEAISTPRGAAQEIMKRIATSQDVFIQSRNRDLWIPVVVTPPPTRVVYHNLHTCGFCRPNYPQDPKITGLYRKRFGELVVHKENCPHLTSRPLGKHSKLIPMIWQPQPPIFRVAFVAVVEDRRGLILDLARKLRRHHSDLMTINAEAADPKTGVGHVRFTIETHSEKEVLDIWEEVYKIENIVEVVIDPIHTPDSVRERMNMLYQHREALTSKTVVEFAWEEVINTLPPRSSNLLNPFDISRPPLPKMFFGRTEEIRQMQRELCEMERGSALIMYGPRRCGKSSICKNFIDNHVRSPHWGVLFSLQNMTRHSEATILMQLADRVSSTFSERFHLRAPKWEDYRESDAQIRFKRLLQDCLNRKEGSRLVLALDEFGGALESYSRHTLRFRFFTFWRELMAEVPQLSLIFALPTSAHTTLSSPRFSHVFSFAQPLALSYLDVESAKHLLADPLRDLQVAIHPNTVALAVSLTGGSPYYMTLLGREIISLLNKDTRKQLVSDKDLYAAVDQFIRSDPFQNFDYLKAEIQQEDEFTLLEKMMECMSQSGQNDIQLKKLAFETRMQVATARRHLDRLRAGLILEENGPPNNPFYSFKIDLVRQWLNRNRSFFTR